MVANLRPALCAAFVVFSFPVFSLQAWAGGPGQHHPPRPHIHHHGKPHWPGAFIPPGTDGGILPSPHHPRRRHTPPPVFFGGHSFPTVTNVIIAAPEPRPFEPVRPESFNVLDPYAAVTRAPSGRVVVTGSNAGWPQPPAVQPYAPPAFHIIGQGSTRNMRGPVQVTHGVHPDADRPTGPRVIWLKEPGERRAPVKSGG
jgi:hypothetical protein